MKPPVRRSAPPASKPAPKPALKPGPNPARTRKPDQAAAQDGPERIAKYLARAGIASRRDAERMIAEGRVRIDGKILDTPAVKVAPGAVVMVDDRPVAGPEATRLWRYHKPRGLVTSHRDELGRPTVFEHLPPDLPRVVSVGRLDINSEGLLLLTNDGALARRLELPTTGWLRKYRVRVFGEPQAAALERLARGIEVDGVRYGPIEVVVDKIQGGNAWLTVGLREGKNREIKRVMEAIGLKVNRLIRVSYGPFALGKLPEGAVDPVPAKALGELLGAPVTGPSRAQAAPKTPERPRPEGQRAPRRGPPPERWR